MKKTFLRKLVLLSITVALHNICIAQQYLSTGESEQAGVSEVPAAEVNPVLYEAPGTDVNTAIEATLNAQEDLSIQTERAMSTAAAASPDGTLNAPPDCPECTPDPGGGVADVPFDRKLLFILLAGAISIIVRTEKRRKKAAVGGDKLIVGDVDKQLSALRSCLT